MQFIATMSFPGPSSSLGSAPPAHSASKRPCLHPTDHLDNEHFRDRLGILFDLVFELRKEVADLKYRLQATEENAATFLHILSTMHMELSSDQVVSAPGEVPATVSSAGREGAQRPAEATQEEAERRGQAEDTGRGERKEKRWDDQPTFIEEEPWTEDLRATWIGYAPGV
jgi:hypothetical protein